MYSCPACWVFLCFGEMRVVHLENPLCDCPGHPLGRAQVAGECDHQFVPRAVYYCCAIGACGFFRCILYEDGEAVRLRSGRLGVEEVMELRP